MRVAVSRAGGRSGQVQRWTVSSYPEQPGEQCLPRRVFVLEAGGNPRDVDHASAVDDPRFRRLVEKELSYEETVELLIQYPRFFFLDERESLRTLARDQAQSDALGRAVDVLIPIRRCYDF